MVDNSFHNIREVIREGELVPAVEALDAWLNANPPGLRPARVRDWRSELILHAASARRVEADARRGVITKEQVDVELRQISLSILRLIDEIEKQSSGAAPLPRAPASPGPATKKILVLAANPIETDRLRIDEETRLIKERLNESAPGQEYSVEVEWGVRATDLSRFLLQHRPVIVHFSGHGSPTGDIILQDDNGRAAPLDVVHLARLFEIVRGSTECVVLNACYSLERAQSLARFVAFVAGMERSIGDPSALRFSAGFYRALAFGQNYNDAFRLGCNEIDLASLPDSAVPHITVRPDEGVRRDFHEIAAAPVRTWMGPALTTVAVTDPDLPRVYPVWFGTDRQPNDINDLTKGFSNERAQDESSVYYGTCQVTIPKSHSFGSLGSSWWQRFLRGTDDRLRVQAINALSEAAFWSSARDVIARLDVSDRMALVFIHGFCVTFEEAAIRAAQIGFDLKVPGITAFYSWPSRGRLGLFNYNADEATIGASGDKICAFLETFAEQTDASRVHVIAHSMGNRGLLRTLDRIVARAARVTRKPFHHIIFAAPDVDAAEFRNLARQYRDIADHATLYVSSFDRAIESSGIIHKAPRAGFVPPVTIVQGIDTVEVSNVDLTLLGHGYYGAAEGVLYDMRELIVHDTPPKSRTRLNDSGQGYWQIGR
jgi:esterase/lipase superfamily enzyme